MAYKMVMSKVSRVTLSLLFSFPIVGAVLFTPALASLIEEYHISASLSQLTIVVYLAGYTLSQLIYGWLLTRVGCAASIQIGLGLFVISSIFCASIHNFYWLVAARAVMAMGAAVGLMMTFHLVTRHFLEDKRRAVFAQLALVISFAPGIANLMGGQLVGFLGWRSCFYFLSLYGLFVMWRSSKLPKETIKEPEPIFSAYLTLLKNPRFILLALMTSLTSAVIYVFASIAPLAAIYVLQTAPQLYGVLSLAPLIGAVSGCLLAAKYAQTLNVRVAIAMGLCLSLLGVALHWGCMHFGGIHLWSLFIPMPFIYFGMAFIYPNGIAMALERDSRKSAAGPGLFGAFNAGISLIVVLITGSLNLSLDKISWIFGAIFGLMTLLFMSENLLKHYFRPVSE